MRAGVFMCVHVHEAYLMVQRRAVQDGVKAASEVGYKYMALTSA